MCVSKSEQGPQRYTLKKTFKYKYKCTKLICCLLLWQGILSQWNVERFPSVRNRLNQNIPNMNTKRHTKTERPWNPYTCCCFLMLHLAKQTNVVECYSIYVPWYFCTIVFSSEHGPQCLALLWLDSFRDLR